ncbi:MAG: metal-dependent hydrolase [Candidatus Thermoplasmatota archaeon]
MKIKWLGHACFIIEGRDRIIIDPFIEGNPLCNEKVSNIKVDIVAITHSHDDHLGNAIEIAKNNNAKIVAIHEIACYAQSKGANAEGVNIGGGIKIKDTEIYMVPAFHSSSNTCPAGLVIDTEKPVYHAGDTCLFSDMKLIGEIYKPYIALLPIGGRYTMDARQAAMAVELIKPKIAIPMHYNTFDLIKCNPEEFKKLVKKAEVIIMKPNEEIEIK